MNRIWSKGMSVLLVSIMTGSLLSGCMNSSGNGEGDGEGGGNTLKILHNWNGSGGSDNGITPIEEVIKEKTGVTLEWEYTKGSETEKVNQIFATQDLPDIYTGPAWGGELDGIIKAAKEG